MLHFIHERKGTVIVEFALVLPIFLLILCAILDFGNMFYQEISVNQAAREASRVFSVTANSVLNDKAITDATASAQKYVTGLTVKNTNDAGVKFASTDSLSKGTNIMVKITNNVESITPLISKFFSSNPYPITEKAIMQVEGS